MLKRGCFEPDSLALVAKRENFNLSQEPPLRLGDTVSLNSGSPQAVVVDVDDLITVAWRNSEGTLQEVSFPAACLHRVSPANKRPDPLLRRSRLHQVDGT